MGLKNDGDKIGDGAIVPRSSRGNNGLIPHSFRALSWIVSSGASTVASTVRSAASAASAIVERDGETNHDKVTWAGFDKLELGKGIARQVLLLGFSYGFQVWDVEVADNVRNLASRDDGPVSFMQMLPKPLSSTQLEDKFAHNRPLLIICASGSFSGDSTTLEGVVIPRNGSVQQYNGSINGSHVPSVVWFYSLKTLSYVHLVRFRSIVHLVRCSCRVVAILQSTQIHCLNAATLEREYTFLTNPVTPGCYGSGNIGVGSLAVGPRWMAYSGNPVVTPDSGRVSPQHLTPSFPGVASNGSLVAHYAKESSKQLAAGIVTLGDMGYKKLTRYYSDLLPEGKNAASGTIHSNVHGVANGHSPDADNVGLVIIRDIVDKTMVVQFRAHKLPISSLCFDPSGTLLVTASVQGHNINVFRIMPGQSNHGFGSPSGPSYAHLYRLQRGLTNAVIQDISFSSDSQWIMISSSRGTSHLFAISPSGGMVSLPSIDSFINPRVGGTYSMAKLDGPLSSGLQVLTPQRICEPGRPINLAAVSRIKNGSNGWRNSVSGAAAAATGRSSSLPGVIASAFHRCKGNDMHGDFSSSLKNHYLLVFSPSGCVIQYALRFSPAFNAIRSARGASVEPSPNSDVWLIVEAMQKWNICQSQSRKDQGTYVDMYGENGNSDSNKVYPERTKCEGNLFSDVLGLTKKDKITTEEKHHMYISEAELQMHQNQNPLWVRSEIYFQSLQTYGFDRDEAAASGGEIEIEKVPIRTLEARSKDLIPVYNYLQTPKLQQGRIRNSNHREQLQLNRFDVSGNGKLAHRRNSSSLDSIANSSLENTSFSGPDENGLDALHSTGTVGVFVNTTNDASTVGTRLQTTTVHTRESSVRDSHFSSVHNRNGLNMDDQFAEDDELFD